MSNEQASNSAWIVNTSADAFEQDVFERSRRTIVVVDFWAEWCAPCRMLAPLLEGLTVEYDGKFTLVKANTDHVQDAAMQFGVQGIPAVYGVIDGEIVDFFSGALPEQQIRGWLERLFSAGSLAEAQRLEATVPEAAEAAYRALMAEAVNDAAPRIGLARVLLNQDRLDECRAVIEELQQRGFLEPEAEKVKAALELHGMQGIDLDAIRAQAQGEPRNLELRLKLAEAQAGAQHFEEALETCLTLVQQDRHGVGEQARQVMVDIFRVLPDDSELTSTYRRKLSMALY